MMHQLMPLHWGQVTAKIAVSGFRRPSGRGTIGRGGFLPATRCAPVMSLNTEYCKNPASMVMKPLQIGTNIVHQLDRMK